MIYSLMDRGRIAALVALVLLPPAILGSIVLGTFWHVIYSLREWLIDLKHTLTSDIPHAYQDILKVLRKGTRN